MSNNPTSILASFVTMKSLVDAKQYQSPYQILAEFMRRKLHYVSSFFLLIAPHSAGL